MGSRLEGWDFGAQSLRDLSEDWPLPFGVPSDESLQSPCTFKSLS